MIKLNKKGKNKFELELIENDIIISKASIKDNVIENIEVNDKFRHISFGKKTLYYIIAELSKRKYDEVIVLNYNEAGKNFFLKNGFILEAEKLVLSGLKEEREEKRQLLNTSIISFIINIILASMKVFVGYVFNLNSIIADGINSATDSLSTIFAIFGIKISTKKENEKYPFGYGKIEAIFNLFIGFFIFITTASVFYASIKKLFINPNLELDKKSFLIYLITFVFILLKLFQYLYVNTYAKKYKNEVLLTLSKDYLADIMLGIAVLVGVILTIKFSYIYDALLSIIISLYIMYQAFDIAKQNIDILLEKQDEKLIRKVRTIIMRNKDVFFCHDLYMIRSGKSIYMYADIRINKDYSLEKAHEIAEEVSIDVKNRFKNIKNISFHMEPIYI
ncbi:cation diffusion facilitator family transporter [Oceanivirga miroungae]|uniref:Cation diffusion facilitator family transporter n=1 Tax=Oceanivirga miroungae TaxID=1130046 RepID=A0A6I8MD84_9FUSO|nr:cation diffusion facilitator family transporter [Oceanivirga miroungae]VWL85113.1 cation diffusion facilitator family transporter [Oceanivirga miroungae]